MVNKKRGRPAGPSRVRDELLAAARQHLDEGDLARTSTRALAAKVGVSHTLVNYYFGSRDGLLAAAAALQVAPHTVLAAATDERGVLDVPVLLRELVGVW